MRLWHKDLIPVLPQKQLVAQWRELLAIKGAIDKNGTPNHRLVNKVLDYSLLHFKAYTQLVYEEMIRRGYQPSEIKYNSVMNWYSPYFPKWHMSMLVYIYDLWHNDRYLRQCYYNLQEKYDCGIVSDEEWKLIEEVVSL